MKNTLTNASTVSILTVLQEAARTSADPKPALRDASKFNGDIDAEWAAQKLANQIEIDFSQVTALENLRIFPLTPSHISLLRIAESCNQLHDGYEDVAGQFDLEAAEQPTPKKEGCKLNREETIEFLKTLLEGANKSIEKALAQLAQTATSARLRELAPVLLAAIKEDGKTLNQAIKESKAFDLLTTRVVEFGTKTDKLKEVLEPYYTALEAELKKGKERLTNLDAELKKRGINWKVGLAAVGGFLVAAKLFGRRR